MGSSVDDLIVGMKVLSPPDIHLYDTETTPIGWRWDETLERLKDKSKVRIGFLAESPLVLVSESSKRALMETRKTLERKGYEIVDVSFSDDFWQMCRDTLYSMVANGNCQAMFDEIDDSCETIIPRLALMKMMIQFPDWLRWVTEKLMIAMGRSR